MAHRRQRVLAITAGVMAIFASLPPSCVASSPIESCATNPQWEACRRTAMVFFQAQMRWAFAGRYPSSLQELCQVNEGTPIGPLAKSQIADPCSLHGLLLRYRLSEGGPEVASIGPDRRWGGWQASPFFGEDDTHVSALTARSNLEQFLHATYCQAVASGCVQYPTVLLKGRDADAATYNTIQARVVRHPVEVAQVADVAEALRAELGVTIAAGAEFFEQEATGLRGCFAQGKTSVLFSFSEAVSILGESCPAWLHFEVWSPKGIALEIRHWSPTPDEEEAFWQMLSPQTDPKMRQLRSVMADFGPSATMVLLPEQWFDDDSYARFATACQRVLGTKEQVVYRIPAGVCVTGFEGWSQAYFFAEEFKEFLPSSHDWLEARDQLRQAQGRGRPGD